ncbi:hypothetical protein BpHYR1_037436 [Brachionus plicatilis]|uniref:Uncharacterized protein n=1 Tax=Brachionus plicatilis TaxID=10195 RepID=A0A3M7QSV4_BRAPC|nr:hypothetical protein BpHYR1_037436 [Brachionus plicatilis]
MKCTKFRNYNKLIDLSETLLKMEDLCRFDKWIYNNLFFLIDLCNYYIYNKVYFKILFFPKFFRTKKHYKIEKKRIILIFEINTYLFIDELTSYKEKKKNTNFIVYKIKG